MSKILFIFILSMFCASGAGASEVLGKISTDPKSLSIDSNDSATESPAGNSASAPLVERPAGSASGLIFPKQKPKQAEVVLTDGINNNKEIEKVKVLGARLYPDKTLLRSGDKRIYLITGQTKKPIMNLSQLAKYRGQVIFDVANDELSQYTTREHVAGELIREKGTVKVYVIKQGLKQHILNLEELRAHYFGLEIFNISQEEMSLY